MQGSTLIIIITLSVSFTSAKLRFVLDEEITKCSDKLWQVDISGFELVMINDTATVANGTAVIITEIKSPWKLIFYGEMFDRGQWEKKFERKFDDFCKYNLKFGEM